MDLMVLVALAGDTVCVVIGQLLAHWLRFSSGLLPRSIGWFEITDLSSNAPLGPYLRYIAFGSALLILLLFQRGLYQRRSTSVPSRWFRAIVKQCVVWGMIFTALSFMVRSTPPVSRIYVFESVVLMAVLLLAWRHFFASWLVQANFGSVFRQRAAIVGWSKGLERLVSGDQSSHARSVEVKRLDVVGCIALPGEVMNAPASIPRLGCLDDISKILTAADIETVVVGEGAVSGPHAVRLVAACEARNVTLWIVPSYFEIMLTCLNVEMWNGVPVLGLVHVPLQRLLNRMAKRSVDILGALVGLFLFAPAMAIAGILILIESPGPILFRQRRMGRYSREFSMLKLRSMAVGADRWDQQGQSTRRDDPRLLKVGKYLRRWNIDELPQFWNVLKGEMSLVGPRPERPYHAGVLSEKIPHYMARHGARPGITGWAQIKGWRGETDLNERIVCDLWYLENWSVSLDLEILLRTMFAFKGAC